jgi:serine/threonine-protein kinase
MMVTPSVRLVRQLGHGGMGSVWVADHTGLHTRVVVKFIARELAANPEVLARFSREAAIAAQVKSPHVVQTLDHGVAEGQPYIVMELLEGHDLGTHLEGRKRLAPPEVASIVTQLARALDRAHRQGVIHRDIKPDNIFLCDTGEGEAFVKLLDFGIAKSDPMKLDGATKTGSTMGTPYYMSPEQLVGAKDVDFHADLWSVGIVAFEALTGEKPFDADTLGGIAVKVHAEARPRLSAVRPELPAALDGWFARACARNPADRFGSGREMAEAFALAATGVPLPPRAPASDPEVSRVTPPLGAGPFVDEALAKTALDTSSTDAGLARSGGQAAGARGKWLAIGGGAILLLVIAGITAPKLRSRAPAAATATATATTTATPTATATATPTATATATPTATATATPTATATATPTATATTTAHALPRPSARGSDPTVTQPSSPPPSTAPAPPPSAKGHDIF